MPFTESQLTQFWGKCDRETLQTFPAVWHMLDVALVADKLLNSLSEQEQQIILGPFSESSNSRQVFLFLIALHDIGKLSPQFQYLVPEIITFDKEAFPAVESSCKHGTVGQSLLSVVLREKLQLDTHIAKILASFTVSHHGKLQWQGDLQLNKQLRAEQGRESKSKWRPLQLGTIEWLREQVDIQWQDIKISLEALTPQWFALASGLCCIADWLGSDNSESCFPYTKANSYSDIKAERLAKAKDVVASKHIKPRITQDTELHSFETIFKCTPRKAQQKVSQIAQQTNASRLTIIETETGSGKTESALYLVDCLLRTANTRGAYIAMPSQATANQLFYRVLHYLKGHPAHYQYIETTLMHSNAELNPALLELRAQAIANDDETTGKNVTPSVVNSQWFSSKKRGCLSSFAVGTIDQLLMSGLLVKHNFVRLFGFAGRTVVLDEVHSLDAYQLEMLKNLLQWLALLECPVVILSATLPLAMREALFSAYLGPNKIVAFEDLQQPYPRISFLNEQQNPECTTLNEPELVTKQEKHLQLHQAPHYQHIAQISAALIAELEATDGQDVLVCIVNTVRDAQLLFDNLSTYLQGSPYSQVQTLLFHARFLMGQKQQIEQQIEFLLGPGDGTAPVNSQRPCKGNGMVLIGTQVLEQSLNFDASCMFTVGAPIDLLLQRLGRLHRFSQNNPHRHPRYQTPRMHIWLADNSAPVDTRFGASGYVYPPYILQQTSDCLLSQATNGQLTFSPHRDMDSWIENVYGDLSAIDQDNCQTESDVAWQEKQDQAFVHKSEQGIKRRMAAKYLFKPEPDLQDMLKGAGDALEDDELQVQTRLASPSITLVFLHVNDGHWCTVFDNKMALLSSSYDKDAITAFKLSSVSISNPDWVSHFSDESYQPLIWQQHNEQKRLWQKTSLLYGCVPVCLGADATYNKNSTDWLKLDPVLGVVWNDKQKGDKHK